MEIETATKLIYATLATVFTAMGIYSLYRAYMGIEESIWISIGYLLLGFLGWVLLFVRSGRSFNL